MANPNGGTGFPGQIQARDSVTKVPLDLFADEASGSLKIASYVWNPDTLSWDRMLQPNVDPTGGDVDYVLTYYDGSANMEYYCSNPVHGAATSATTWTIKKYFYGANGITGWQKLPGSVDGRAALGWV